MFCISKETAATDRAIDEAMDRFAAGEHKAFTEVYTAALPRIARSLERLTHQRAAAEDLAQETMVRIYGARASWRPGARVLPWAHTIARRLFIDRLRCRRREELAHEALVHHETGRGGFDAAADVHLVARRMAATLTAAAQQLPAAQRQALQLVCLEGKSLAEVSAELGQTSVAVRVRVHRARCVLAEALAEH
jgi:RNA polymerase sigma-70 factor (ECF subfamily)